MDGPPALTLGLEPTHGNLMNRLPTKRHDNIVSKVMLIKIALTGAYISIIFLCQYVYNFLSVTDGQMPTVLFTLFTLFQLFNSFNCRELHSVSILNNLFKNKIMLLVITITFVLQIVIIQFGGAFFGTIPLDLILWMKIFAISFSVVLISELVKFVWRRVDR